MERVSPCQVLDVTAHVCAVATSVPGLGEQRLNTGILGSVQWRLPGWQEPEWEQRNMSGRALALQIGSEMAPRPFTGRVN